MISDVLRPSIAQTLFRLFGQKALDQRASVVREDRLHGYIIFKDHLELLKLVLVPHLEGVDAREHLVDH